MSVAVWTGVVDVRSVSRTAYLIDYEQRALTPLINQDGCLYLEDERVVRYADLFSKK